MTNAASLVPRQAIESDVERIGDVVTEAYERYGPRMDTVPPPVVRDPAIDVAAEATWVIGDPIDGVITLRTAGDDLLVENVAVQPSAQGRGLGRILMTFAEDEARRQGINRLTLSTNVVMTENFGIYLALGYREYDRRTEDGYHRVYFEKVLDDLA
jgi:GNAT superfamily N-acetyltransferase